MSCKCINITPGSVECYKQMVTLEVPETVELFYNRPEKDRRHHVSIDPCLVNEIKKLWSLGISTTGCCCGHNTPDRSYIGVYEQFIPKMKELGYEVRKNQFDHSREDSFIPKSV